MTFKFCPSCGFHLAGGSSDVPKIEQYDSHKPIEEIDNRVVKKTIIKKVLSEKQLNALAETRKKMADKRALAKKEKESNEEVPKKSKVIPEEKPVETNIEKPQIYRRKLFD